MTSWGVIADRNNGLLCRWRGLSESVKEVYFCCSLKKGTTDFDHIFMLDNKSPYSYGTVL